jgi:hypothetical protein
MVVGLMYEAMGSMGEINCEVKRSRTSSNCSTSDRCRHLAVYGLSLSSAAAAQVTHLWLEFASGRSEKDGPVEHILAVDAPQIQPGPSEAQWAHNYRSIVLSVLDSSWCWHTFLLQKGFAHWLACFSESPPKNLFSIQPFAVSCRFTSHLSPTWMRTEDANATSCGESPTTSFYCFVVGRAWALRHWSCCRTKSLDVRTWHCGVLSHGKDDGVPFIAIGYIYI